MRSSDIGFNVIMSQLSEYCILQVVSVAMIYGGTAFNVIPDSTTIAGTFRAFSKKSFNALRDRIEEVTTYLLVEK